MSKNSDAANKFIRSLREQREAYHDFAKEEIRPLYGNNDQRDRRPPNFFVDSSYLYARSFDGDNGSRPFANQVFWRSPDIRVSPLSDLSAYTRTLNAGESYNINCTVRNRGDLAAPSAKVEFWLTDPSLGFSTKFARHLTLGLVPTTWVSSNSSAMVNFTYMVPPTEEGHKCLFARVFSFSPLDIPVDDFALDPRIDRHVAQLNLNILRQAEPFLFNWIHAPNANQVIEITPMAPEELAALQHPVRADVTPFRDIPRNEWVDMVGLEFAGGDGADIDFFSENNSLFVTSRDPEGADLATQQEIRTEVKKILAAVDAGETRMADHREIFAAFREMNGQAQRHAFHMRAPDFGMEKGQAIGLNIRSIDNSDQNEREVLGGITLLVVGG